MCRHERTVIHDDLSAECLDCGYRVPNPIVEDLRWYTFGVVASVVLAGLIMLSFLM